MPNAVLLAITAAQVGMILVKEVSRKPRNRVSSNKGARTPTNQQATAAEYILLTGRSGSVLNHVTVTVTFSSCPAVVQACTATMQRRGGMDKSTL